MRFHAAPPAGEWLNDPNGLVFADGQWRLFAQHRADAPDYRATGWARLSGPDLLRWAWDGPAIAPDGARWAYSGCMRDDAGALTAFHTEHEGGLERQVARASADAGRTWGAARDLGLPRRRDRRDPFVWHDAAGWRMLLAAPCGWTTWRDDGPSRALLCAADDPLGPWREVAAVEPGFPAGVMLEVPAYVPGWGMLVSLLDRRGDGADGSAWRWRGAFDGDEWRPAAPPERLDWGPDFYAAIPATGAPLCVGWASGWATARRFPWGGFAGGPISLPRAVSDAGLAVHAPLLDGFADPAAACPAAGVAVADVSGGFRLTRRGAGASLTVEQAGGRLRVRREGPDGLEWDSARALGCDAALPAAARLTLFVDGPLTELHIAPADRWVTAALPTAGPFDATLEGGAFAWRAFG